MRCFWDPARPFWGDVPAPQAERFMIQRAQDSLDVWGVRIVGTDIVSAIVDLQATDATQFLRWCSEFGICRCDFDRPSDVAAFMGRSPLSLGVIRSFDQLRPRLTSLEPDEIYSTLENLAGEVLNSGNAHMSRLEHTAENNEIGGIDLAATEYEAGLALEQAGFALPPERSLEPEHVEPLTAADYARIRGSNDDFGPAAPRDLTDPFGRTY